MAESYGWVFVDFLPLLYEKRRVARQYKVETWLDLTQLLKELQLEGLDKRNTSSTMKYVV